MGADIKELVRDVLEGDTEAFAEIIDLYQNEVGRVIAGMLFSNSERDDLIQQTFIDAFTNLERYDNTRDFGNWVKGIARNLALHYMRSSKRRFRHLEEYRKQKEARVKERTSQSDPEWQFNALSVCFNALPKHIQNILKLKYTNALNINSIAQKLGRSDASVQKTLSRARMSLKECIERKALAT